MTVDETNAGNVTKSVESASVQTTRKEGENGATPVVEKNVELAAFQREFFLRECVSLHDEINARMAQRGNLFTFTIITAGSLLSLGASTNAQIALFYPVLSFFLAAAWSDEDKKIGVLSAYLREQEQLHNLTGWETYRRAVPQKPQFLLPGLQQFYPKSTLSLATRGVFLSTQVLAVLVGFTQAYSKNALLTTLPLLSIAILATILTAFIIQHQRNHTLSTNRTESAE